MNKLPCSVLKTMLVIFSGFLAANISCITIPPRTPCPSASSFDGCFESSDLGGSVIRLDEECGILSGILLIGQPNDPAFRAYSLEGEEKTRPSETEVGVADLFGTLSSPNDNRTERITALLATDDTMRVVVGNEVPIGPMSRCFSIPGT